MIRKTDLAYAAGIIDGEGCIHIARRKGKKRKFVAYALHIVVTINDKPVIDFLHNLFGGSKRHVVKKNVWTWESVGLVAENALRQVLPWMLAKKPQAELALRFRGLIGTSGHRPPQSNMTMRDKLYWKLRELKVHNVA